MLGPPFLGSRALHYLTYAEDARLFRIEAGFRGKIGEDTGNLIGA
jgi:hypothetical protein